MLLHTAFLDTCARVPERTALIDAGERYTYAELARAVERLGVALQERGVSKGDRVAIFLENSAAAVIAVYAALRIGAIFMVVNSQTKAEKLAYTLNDAGARCLITQHSLARVYAAALARTPTVSTCIVAGGAPADSPNLNIAMRAFADIVNADSAIPPVAEPELIDQDLAALIYTSGSTGEPKGVMLSHLNMVAACTSVISYLELLPTDVIFCALPLSFGYGLYQVLMAFRVGGSVVLERSFAFPVKILEQIANTGVTVFPGVPTMFNQILNLRDVDQFDLRALRVVTNAAAALTLDQIARIRSRFPQAKFFSMYGLTECKRVSFLPPEQLDVRPDSVGRGMPNQECWLVGENGERLANGSTGELVVRGSHVMRGYWGKPEATDERLKPGPLPGERILHTGDIFRTDAEGYLYFVGRKDDIIKSRGEKVSPKEVESVLYSLEGVREAAVIGVADPILGEAIKACIALAPGYAYSEKEIIGFCQAKLENFMVPKFVQFFEALPKTHTGKIQRLRLREQN